MSPDLLYHLDQAVAEVFELMLSQTCTPTEFAACAHALPGLTASVAFSGSLLGSCVLHLDFSSALQVTEALTGERSLPSSTLASDTVGELCNMIAGSWKSRLAPHLSTCHLSPPAVTPSTPLAEPTRHYHFSDHCLTLALTLAQTIESPPPHGWRAAQLAF